MSPWNDSIAWSKRLGFVNHHFSSAIASISLSIGESSQVVTGCLKKKSQVSNPRGIASVICYVVTASQTVSDLLRDKPKENISSQLRLCSPFSLLDDYQGNEESTRRLSHLTA